MFDIPVTRVPRRIFSITVLPDRIYCSTNEHITVVDFRDVEGASLNALIENTSSLKAIPGVEVKCKAKKNRAQRERDNCLLQ